MSPFNHSATRELAISRDDAALVLAAKSGEHCAFVELFHRHSAKVLRATYKVTRNHHDAEDAMQDAFLKAYAHLGTFDGRAAFSSWLIRIAINSSLLILRGRRRRPETSIESIVQHDPSHSWDVIDCSVDIETHYLVEESAVHLRAAIRRLRPPLRSVVEIQQRQDGSLREVAQIANLSVAATKSRLLRARQALRRTMR